MSTPLSALGPGQAATICDLSALDDPARLLEMGLIEGTRVEFIRRAPGGDPIEIRVMGYSLSVRREDAEGILVEDVNPA